MLINAPPPSISPTKVYLASVMPCYDKKLEASRDDFYNDLLRTRDVDCVIATGELEAILQENGIVLGSMEPSTLDSVVQPGVQEMPVGQPGSSSVRCHGKITELSPGPAGLPSH